MRKKKGKTIRKEKTRMKEKTRININDKKSKNE